MRQWLLVLSLLLSGWFCSIAYAAQDWQATLAEARGQTVYFHAWGGQQEVNDYLQWVAAELARQYDIHLVHVKVADIAESAQRLVNENQAEPSAVDLLWINGENFHFLKRQQQLLAELDKKVPNRSLLAPADEWQRDFGVATDGYELPWGVGQFQLLVREQVLNEVNATTAELSPQQLLRYARKHPGRISYPKPPEFHGSTWLKNLIWSLSAGDPRLLEAPTTAAEQALLPLLWAYLDELHPLLWRAGEEFPASQAQTLNMLANQQLDMALSFSPQQLSQLQQQGLMPRGIRRAYLAGGAITNHHYLAISRRTAVPAAALVSLNFLLSPEAQQAKRNSAWADLSVLQQARTGANTELFPTAPELHVDWVERLEQTWLARYQ